MARSRSGCVPSDIRRITSDSPLPPARPLTAPFFPRSAFLIFLLLASVATARPVSFNLPAQPAHEALLAFSQQAGVEVLFPHEALQGRRSPPMVGRFEPEEALRRLLAGTGYEARRNARGKFVVAVMIQRSGVIRGQLLNSEGHPASEARVLVPELRRSARTDSEGHFQFTELPPGVYRVVATAPGSRPLELPEVTVADDSATDLGRLGLEAVLSASRLAPYIVEERTEDRRPFDRSAPPPAPRTAAGNLDLRRTENDVLAFTVFDRDRILRSGVVDLNEFLQRELLESDATNSNFSNSDSPHVVGGSSNLRLRGYFADETVILVNGRRLPEMLTILGDGKEPPDVNFIPLSLVQRVEVLPSSASALYSGNAVGGVINIVLRPDVDVNATEVMTTYTNALHGYDAPHTSASLMHGRSFLNGALRIRLNGTHSRSVAPTESELGYQHRRVESAAAPGDPLYRATPNIRSANGSPLFGPGTPTVTSVAPGTEAVNSPADFAGREGVRSTEFFDGFGGFSSSINSQDYAYGREQERTAWFLSTVFDVNPWLQLGFDGIHSRTSLVSGYDLFRADLLLPAESADNPFGQPVRVSLHESAPALGEDYSQAKVEFTSAVLGAVVKLPWDWRLMADAQLARNRVRQRGFVTTDTGRWQQLVDEGRYNPLRDTQVSPPPAAFYDEVLIYRGESGAFVPLGDYQVFDGALRLTREELPLPMGNALLNLGTDYRLTRFKGFTEQYRYGDGSPAGDPIVWLTRTLERVSVFGELQAPLLKDEWKPRWLRRAEVDLAARYIYADTAQETNLAPTYGLKFDFNNGLSVRGSITTSNRFPTPKMHRQAPSGPGSGGARAALIFDPRRGETYEVQETELLNLALEPEDALTQSAGLRFQRGEERRFRASLDYFDTRKNNESIFIDPQLALTLEDVWPERVERDSPAAGETLGRVSHVLTGRVNAAWRRSRTWSASLSYDQDGIWGGVLEAYARWMYLQSFELQFLPNDPVVDQLNEPDGSVPGLLRHRTNLGIAWSNRTYGVGADSRYYHSRRLPANERELQGSASIDAHWQFDLYTHVDVRRLLRWPNSRFGLRAQLRVNNVFGPDFPSYWRTGVSPYGDVRGRTYSLSVTTVF